MKLAIYGAGGHAKVVVELAKQLGYRTICLFDERWKKLEPLEGCEVIGGWQAMLDYLSSTESCSAHVAIGHNITRLDRLKTLQQLEVRLPVLVHPRAYVCSSAQLGDGSVVMANSTISVGCEIGLGNIINHNSSIDHDVILADGVHIAPGCNLAGEVRVGCATMVGIGSSVIQQIVIKDRAIIGAGSVVVKDVKPAEKVYGNPAKTH
ncbi:acetyltransferase [Agarivorans sp. DSG3-1]|uniref:acetyltransferase n=1 Tax=Agarivorans sp. DSG3-1 TaxID=3342249 RepID=UPI00398EC5B2